MDQHAILNPCQMGVQLPRGVHPEMSQEGCFVVWPVRCHRFGCCIQSSSSTALPPRHEVTATDQRVK
jgi:hypothetical protein